MGAALIAVSFALPSSIVKSGGDETRPMSPVRAAFRSMQTGSLKSPGGQIGSRRFDFQFDFPSRRRLLVSALSR